MAGISWPSARLFSKATKKAIGQLSISSRKPETSSHIVHSHSQSTSGSVVDHPNNAPQGQVSVRSRALTMTHIPVEPKNLLNHEANTVQANFQPTCKTTTERGGLGISEDPFLSSGSTRIQRWR